MFKETIAKIREEVAEFEQFDYTSDDLVLATNITGRIRKRLKELEEDLGAANEKARKEFNDLCNEYHEQLKLHYNELKATKKELAQKDEKIEKLYHDLDASDREINNLREDNVALVERIEKLENERRISLPCKLIDELQDSREKIEELTKHNDDLRRELNKKANRLHDEIKLYNELKSTKLENENLRKDNTCLLNQLEKLERESDERIFNKTADELMKKIYERVNDALMNMNNKKEN